MTKKDEFKCWNPCKPLYCCEARCKRWDPCQPCIRRSWDPCDKRWEPSYEGCYCDKEPGWREDEGWREEPLREEHWKVGCGYHPKCFKVYVCCEGDRKPYQD